MIRYILVLALLLQIRVFAIPTDSSILSWAEQGYKDFRTYPRLNRAYKLIEANKTKEAKTLLEKVLKIDSSNQKAVDMILNLCLQEKNIECINSYIDRAKDVNLGYVYKQKAQIAKDNKEYKKAIELAKKALGYKLKKDDREFVNLIIFDSYLKLKEYKQADSFIKRDDLITYQLLKWSKISDNLGESRYAYSLASELPNKIEYLKWQSELLLKNREYKEASKKMELLYQRVPTAENKKQLLYLYSLTKQDKNILKVYKNRLAKGCDEYALNFLLNYYKKSNKKEYNRLLEKEYPYSCVNSKERVELSLELMNILKDRKPKKVKQIAKNIKKYIEKTSSEKKRLAFYQLSGQKNRIVKIYKKRLAKGCNRYALLYLLDFYKDNKKEYNRILQDSYPYRCLSKEKQAYLSLELVNLLGEKNPIQQKVILNSLNIKDIKPSQYLNISNIEAKIGDYQKSIDYALAYLKYYPNDILAIKNIGYSYFKLGKKELSAHYLIQASKLDPNDIDLLKNIGYLCVDLKQYNTAIYYWRLYLDKKLDPKIELELASLYYYHIKDYDKANELLKSYEKSTKIYTAQYYILKAKLAYRNQNCKLALNSYSHAVKVKSDENTNYEYAHLLQQCKEDNKATKIIEKLSQNHPNNIQYKKELAYMYDKNRNYRKAIRNFQDVIKKEPQKTDNHLALAYAYKKVGKKKKAVEEFKKAIDNSPNMDRKKLKNIKNEIRNSSKKFDVYIAQSFRLDKHNKNQSINSISNSTYNGFGSIELSYRPEFLPKRTTLFANILHNHQNIEKSLQPSVGVRYQPIKDRQLYISAQKLIKSGKSSRDDTLLRASLGISSNPNAQIYQNLYLDSGYFTKADSIIAYANYEVGKKYNINKNLKISPYITTGGTFNNDNSKKKEITNLDIGLGVSMDITPDETKYEPIAYKNRLKLEARQKYAGNSRDKNSIHLQWEFFY